MSLFLIIDQQYISCQKVLKYLIVEKTTHKQKYLLIKSFCFSSQPGVGELLMWFQELLRHLFAIILSPVLESWWWSRTCLNQQLCSPASRGALPTAVFPLQIAIIYLMSQIFLAGKYFHTLWYISVNSEPASLFRIQLNALFSFKIEKKTFIPHLCRIILTSISIVLKSEIVILEKNLFLWSLQIWSCWDTAVNFRDISIALFPRLIIAQMPRY